MKNLYLIPTDKPSCLSIIDGQLIFSHKYFINPQHLYITSDEAIKEEDWCIDIISKHVYKHPINSNTRLEYQKKIILTTNPHLIKDGIQSIDDDFLLWFVKNPSCDEVEIVKKGYKKNGRIDEATSYNYKIIISKKELDYPKLFEKFKETLNNIPKEVLLEYINTNDCTSMIYNSKQELNCPYDFTSRCTIGRCDCKLKQSVEEYKQQGLEKYSYELESKQEWQEIFPDVVWNANIAPSGEQHFYFKENDDEITIKGNWETIPNNLKGFEISFKR